MSDGFGGWKVHILKNGLRQSKWIELSNVSSCWNRWPFHSFLVVLIQTSKVEWESAWRKWMLYVRPTKFVIELLFKIQKYHVQLLSMISSSVRARQEVDGFLWLLKTLRCEHTMCQQTQAGSQESRNHQLVSRFLWAQQIVQLLLGGRELQLYNGKPILNGMFQVIYFSLVLSHSMIWIS